MLPGKITIVAKAGKSCADSFTEYHSDRRRDAIETCENNTPERTGTTEDKFRATTDMRSLNGE